MALGTEQKHWIIHLVGVLAKADRAYQSAKESLIGRWLCRRWRKA